MRCCDLKSEYLIPLEWRVSKTVLRNTERRTWEKVEGSPLWAVAPNIPFQPWKEYPMKGITALLSQTDWPLDLTGPIQLSLPGNLKLGKSEVSWVKNSKLNWHKGKPKESQWASWSAKKIEKPEYYFANQKRTMKQTQQGEMETRQHHGSNLGSCLSSSIPNVLAYFLSCLGRITKWPALSFI